MKTRNDSSLRRTFLRLRAFPVPFGVVFLCAALCSVSCSSGARDEFSGTPNGVSVVFCVGDGMGPEQIRAASLFATGRDDALSFSEFPVRGTATTRSVSSAITDSAASATAMATGYKVDNGVVSRLRPGSGRDLTTLAEYASALGKKVGVATTAAVTHATPAAFIAHANDRLHYGVIAGYIVNATRPLVLFGGGGAEFSAEPAFFASAGYTVVQTVEQLSTSGSALPLCGLFADGHLPYEYDGYAAAPDAPRLVDMVRSSLAVLGEGEAGFFLLVEGARIDNAGHDNNVERMIRETIAFSDAVLAVTEWIDANPGRKILLVVTADHETGGLAIVGDPAAGVYPEVTWSTTGHTATPVPYYAVGYRCADMASVTDNTHFAGLLRDVMRQ